MTMRVIVNTCLFKEAYVTWHRRDAYLRTWFLFMTFVCKQCRMDRLTSVTAGDFGYGGNPAHQANAEEYAKFKGYVVNVSAA